MFKIVSTKSGIASCRQEFVRSMKRTSDASPRTFVAGYQGGNEAVEGSYSARYDFWWVNDVASTRYWDVFGLGEPREGKFRNNIIWEVNAPFEGVNRRVQGTYAKNPVGNTFLLHRGKIGGGRKGIGKALFVDNFNGTWVQVDDGGVTSRMAVVADLGKSDVCSRVAWFTREVARIKDLVSSGTATTPYSPLIRRGYSPEAEGESTYDRTGTVLVTRRHGMIVRALRERLHLNRIGTWNSRAIDLVASNPSGGKTTMFEVKTGDDWYSVYEAVGQLFVNSRFLNGRVERVAVMPETVERKARPILDELGVRLLTFRIGEGQSIEFIEDPVRVVGETSAS